MVLLPERFLNGLKQQTGTIPMMLFSASPAYGIVVVHLLSAISAGFNATGYFFHCMLAFATLVISEIRYVSDPFRFPVYKTVRLVP